MRSRRQTTVCLTLSYMCLNTAICCSVSFGQVGLLHRLTVPLIRNCSSIRQLRTVQPACACNVVTELHRATLGLSRRLPLGLGLAMPTCISSILPCLLVLSSCCILAAGSVLQLTDETFEGATQASTGQTTGHWLVFFVCPDNVDRNQYNVIKSATEQLAAEAWNDRFTFRVAEVNTCQNRQLAERFNIDGAEVILFRDRQMYMYPKASVMQQGLKAEALKEFVTVEYELVPPAPVPSQKSWINSLLPLLSTPFTKFFSAFNHQEESGVRLFPIMIGVGMWLTPLIGGLLFLVYLALKGNFRDTKPKQQ